MGSNTSPLLAVLDIDGVVADVRHRLHHIAKVPKDWDAFFAAATQDPLLDAGAQLAHELASQYDVTYLTGRPERNRASTQAWLCAQALPEGPVIMRPDRDHRPARLFKRESVASLRRTHTIVVLVDDDPEVVELLRLDGITTTLAEWQPYTDPMRAGQESDGRT